MKRTRRAPRITATAIAAAIACGVCALFTIDPIDIAIIGVVIVSVGLLWILNDPAGTATMEWPPPPAIDLYGVRRDAMQLAWSLQGRADALGEDIIERVRALVTARLAEHGLDARRPGDAERIVQLGGPTVLRLARGNWPANTTVLLNALAAIDRIPHRPGYTVTTVTPEASTRNDTNPTRSDPAR